MSKKLIRFDWAIKRLLRNKPNFVVLEGFLSELLFDNIKIEKILESESNQESDGDKFNRVDLLTQNSKNELIIIEIQSTYEIDYFHRMAYGVSKNISENLKLGQQYSEIKKVISINIVYFDLGQGQDYIYSGKTDFKGMHQHDLLGLSDKQKTTFLKDKVSDIMRFDNNDKYGYNRYLDRLHLKASDIFTLQTEAEFKLKEEIARKSILKGLDNETISEITDLRFASIELLRKELGSKSAPNSG